MLAVKGQVEAHDAAGTTRALRRGAEVFEADTIVVGSDAYAQIRMVDDATIALKSDTEFTFGTYDYDGNAATPDSATMSMLRGGFRTISGSIGDADEDTYRIDTPYASIGIRGTMHSGVIVDNVLFTGVYDGGTTISNIQGSLDAGIGADFDYTETPGGVAPRGLVEAPPELSLVDLATQFVQLAPAGTPVVGDTGTDAQNDATESAPAFAALANPAAAPQAGNANANVTAPQRPTADLAFVDTLAATANVTGGDPQDDVNPLLFSRAATELDATPVTGGGNNNGNSGNNGSSGGNNGNGNSNAGGNNGNGNGNGNAGGNNGNGNGN
ncbi:MAG: FecR family protein, partial [Pseudomonadota bacterium]|nr:FecR family protein [Pseudomonadota bacterium]